LITLTVSFIGSPPSILDITPDLSPRLSTSSKHEALVDGGASVNVIENNLSSRLGAFTVPCSVQIYLANGDPFCHVKQKTRLRFTVAGSHIAYDQWFLIAPIGTHSIILGMPWLEDANPHIDWSQKTIDFPTTETSKLEESLPPTLVHSKSASRIVSSELRTVLLSSVTTPCSNSIPRVPKIDLTRHIDPTDQLYVIQCDRVYSLDDYVGTIGSSLAPPTEIPAEYKDIARSFSKMKADELPSHHADVDHEIDLEEGTKPIFGPIYNLSENELKVLRDYIDEMLEKGFIRPSTSPFGSPVLFVKKADGSLRLCVDYRALNNRTIKNRYPLPLISEMLDRLVGAKIFTKLDVRNAYHRIRIAAGHEYKTAFRTRYGHFEYLVMPFGLTNAPASFQSFINNVLRKHLDRFVIVYVDDILVYSKSITEHVGHVRQVLQDLLANGIYCKLEKCQFHMDRTSFLGFIVSSDGISMDPDRIASIADWPVPTSVLELQIFLGFANFYRRFIEGYSRIISPITTLLRKGQEFNWTPEIQSAFDELKLRFTSAPILRHFDPALPIYLFTDSSGFALSGILCQIDPGDKRLHPIAFWSRKCLPAECNYHTHDRELLAIVMAMKHWRHYLEGPQHPVTVYTDHKNLQAFMTTKILNRRQARWAEMLAEYNFIVVPIPGKKNPADGPSRRPDYSYGMEPPSGTVFPLQRFLVAAISSSTTPVDSLRRRIIQTLNDDSLARKYRTESSLPWSWDDKLLLYNNLVYVPESLRLEIIRSHHDDPLAGHPGIERTHELVSRNYYFPGMRKFIKSYVTSCDLCARAKPSRHMPHGELAPLPVPEAPWKSISCDFITDLPLSHGYDAILVFVDRFSKMTHIVPCNKVTDAPAFARLFLDYVVRLHGVPTSLVSDRGSIFTSHFWTALAELLGLQRRLSTAFHPQTDGQTERMNQILEQYLRIYCNYQQDDWFNYISLAEFAINNAHQSSLKCSPFYANYGYNPTFSIDLKKSSLSVPVANELAERLSEMHDVLRDNLILAQNQQAKYYDAKHKPLQFDIGDMVWLLSTNIKTARPSKKLDWKRLGPFPIVKRIGIQAYQLRLPLSMKIHNVFHVSLLEPYTASDIPGRVPPPPPPIYLDTQDEPEYEVEEILDSRRRRRALQYLVKWKGYPVSDNSWEPTANVQNSSRLLEEFHARYPEKPRPRT
jgi:hypothetical protein